MATTTARSQPRLELPSERLARGCGRPPSACGRGLATRCCPASHLTRRERSLLGKNGAHMPIAENGPLGPGFERRLKAALDTALPPSPLPPSARYRAGAGRVPGPQPTATPEASPRPEASPSPEPSSDPSGGDHPEPSPTPDGGTDDS